MLHQPSEFVDAPADRARASSSSTPASAGLEGLPFATQPVQLARTPSSIRRPASVDDDADVRADAPRRRRRSGRGRELLLDGVRVIEFGVAAVVPEMCGVLSELGADVIKIESMANLDVLRMGSGSIELIDKSFTFNDECRGRRSVALDLTTERGRELALALCASRRRGRREPAGRRARTARARLRRRARASTRG